MKPVAVPVAWSRGQRSGFIYGALSYASRWVPAPRAAPGGLDVMTFLPETEEFQVRLEAAARWELGERDDFRVEPARQ